MNIVLSTHFKITLFHVSNLVSPFFMDGLWIKSGCLITFHLKSDQEGNADLFFQSIYPCLATFHWTCKKCRAKKGVFIHVYKLNLFSFSIK